MEKAGFTIQGKLVDVVHRKIFNAEVQVENGIIQQVKPIDQAPNIFIAPGFVNAHVHIESSMLSPVQFSKLAMKAGTVAVVSDPHEITNVCGLEGFDYMYRNAAQTPLKVFLGAPSCVPATPFETSGAIIAAKDVAHLIDTYQLKFLSEMMNFPGVVFDDPEVSLKLKEAQKRKVKIDGHAPGLNGKQLEKYVQAGISTDHECTTIEEAREKIKLGMKILIREGSAAKDFDALNALMDEYPNEVMLCTDDSHPDDLVKGHINLIVAKALRNKRDFFNVLRAASYNPIKHYQLEVGLLQEGDPADFILIESFEEASVLATFIDGVKVFDGKELTIELHDTPGVNQFFAENVALNDLKIENKGLPVRVIEAFDGSLLTGELTHLFASNQPFLESDTANDILKLVVINRYKPSTPQIAFINKFGLKKGAIASCIAHDSHNIIALGTNDRDLQAAINIIMANQGGIAIAHGEYQQALPLPIGGIMTNEDGVVVAEKYLDLQAKVHEWGSPLRAPFMTLSFMALLVIPSLKLGDQGLFDVNLFQFADLFQLPDNRDKQTETTA